MLPSASQLFRVQQLHLVDGDKLLLEARSERFNHREIYHRHPHVRRDWISELLGMTLTLTSKCGFLANRILSTLETFFNAHQVYDFFITGEGTTMRTGARNIIPA